MTQYYSRINQWRPIAILRTLLIQLEVLWKVVGFNEQRERRGVAVIHQDDDEAPNLLKEEQRTER